MSALIISNNGGGDYSFHHVDHDRWMQIQELLDARTSENRERTYEAILWLVLDDSECVPPDGFRGMEPRGFLIETWHVQSGVPEKVHLSLTVDILFLP